MTEAQVMLLVFMLVLPIGLSLLVLWHKSFWLAEVAAAVWLISAFWLLRSSGLPAFAGQPEETILWAFSIFAVAMGIVLAFSPMSFNNKDVYEEEKIPPRELHSQRRIKHIEQRQKRLGMTRITKSSNVWEK